MTMTTVFAGEYASKAQTTFVESYLQDNTHDMDSQEEIERLTAKAVGLFKDRAIEKIKDWHEHHTDEYMQELDDDPESTCDIYHSLQAGDDIDELIAVTDDVDAELFEMVVYERVEEDTEYTDGDLCRFAYDLIFEEDYVEKEN